MADEEVENNESEGGGRSAGKAPKQSAKPASPLKPNMARAWVIAGMVSVPIIVLIIVFGLGVLPAAWKGYFGERVHQDAGPVGEDPERTEVVERRDATEQTLSIPKRVQPSGGPCDLVVPDALDTRFLKEGYTFTRGAIGAPEGTRIQPDDAMITTMQYLCRRHSRIAISHIISAYVNMRLDPEEQASRDPQIIANISAHNRGQAYDIVQIDYVYKVFRKPCPPSPNWTIEYWSDESKLLLVFPCREPVNQVNTTFAGGPATAIPIRIAWQDQPSQFALGGLPLNINTALNTLGAYLGLNPEALRFAGGSLQGMLDQIGRVYLEELTGLPIGSLLGGNLPAILENTFGGRLAELVNQLPRTSWGGNLADLVRSVGAGSWEKMLGLFPSSLQGWNNPAELFRSVGLETIASILRVPSSYLNDRERVAAILKNLSEEDRRALASVGALGGGSVDPILSALTSGDRAALDGALSLYGRQILTLTLGLPADAFSCTEALERSCPDLFASLNMLSDRTGLRPEELRRFIEDIASGRSLAGLFESYGLPSLEQALSLPSGTLASWLGGRQGGLDSAAIKLVADRLGISAALSSQLLAAMQQGQVLSKLYQQIGSSLLGRALQLSNPAALFEMATGTASKELQARVEQELNRLAASLNLPSFIQLSQLFSGNFTGILSQLGGLQLGEIFGLSVSQIQQLIGGNLSVLLNLPAFQQLSQTILTALGVNINQLTSILNGVPALSQLASIGNTLNGFLNLTGLDQALVMERVYRPEARRKVRLVLRELLDIPFDLDNIDLRVTQLITHHYERDVKPFEDDGTLDKVYGSNRSRNFGLFAMKEAWDHLHLGY